MKNVDLGMPTLIEIDHIEECVRLCKELGLDFIELNMNLPQYQIDNLNIEQLKKICDIEKIYFTIHLDENLNACDFNRDVANAYIKTILSTIDIAKKLKIPVLNMHMTNGVYFTLPKEKLYLFKKYKDIYLENLERFRAMCEEAVGDSNIKICIENCSGYKDFAMEGIEILLESNIFGLTFDVGHNHKANRADEPFIYKHLDKLYHMHIHDAKENEDHLPLGTGKVKIDEKLLLANKNNCRVVVETKTIESLTQSVGKLKKMVEGP